jgi:ubiquinol-cytochrome c reductase cytochrome b subunit
MPLVVLSLLAVHLTQVIRHGVSIAQTSAMPGPQSQRPVSEGLGDNPLAKPYFPYQTIRNMIVLAMILGTVAIVSWRQGAPLDAPADPMLAHMPRPEWYFLFLFELRRYFAGDLEFVATIVIPLAALAALAMMPLLDRVCSRRWSAALRFVTVVAGGGAWAFLTLTAAMRDWEDPEYQTATQNSARLAARARVLADRQAIGPEGAAALLRDDALTQGPLLFVRHCGSCHSHVDAAGKGILAAEPSAPNLYGFASRPWLTGLFDPSKIAGDQYFGKTAFAKGDMVSTVRSAHGDATEPEEKADLQGRLQKMIAALSAEAQLQLQRDLDRADAETITEGRKLLVGDLDCTSCHKFHKEGELGTAPDLTGYGSREWLLGMIGNPQHERFYDADRNDRMPSFAKDLHEPQANLLSPRELNLLVDWLRGEWYEPRNEPAADSQSEAVHDARAVAEAMGRSK